MLQTPRVNCYSREYLVRGMATEHSGIRYIRLSPLFHMIKEANT